MASLDQPSLPGPLASASVKWHFKTDLMYELPPPPEQAPPRICARKGCGQVCDSEEKQRAGGRCSACSIPWYCSKECQKSDWKRAHKRECGLAKTVYGASEYTSDIKEQAVVGLLQKIRLYMCPFAVAKQNVVGKGFVLLQVNPINRCTDHLHSPSLS